jgi:hypothetical protein
VIDRARIILDNLEGEELDERGRPRLAVRRGSDEPVQDSQLGLFQAVPQRDAISEAEKSALALLKQTDPNRTTPLEALELLSGLVTALRSEVPS